MYGNLFVAKKRRNSYQMQCKICKKFVQKYNVKVHIKQAMQNLCTKLKRFTEGGDVMI